MTLEAGDCDARKLLETLNEFATAPNALIKLFGQLDHESTKPIGLRELHKLLLWQSTAATSTLDDVLTAYEVQDDERQQELEPVRGDTVLLVMGKPALLFATSIYDEELALLIWRGLVIFQQQHPGFDLLRQALDNAADSHGFCSLHYAIDAQMTEFLRTVSETLAQEENAQYQPLLERIVTQDVVLPVSKTQIQGKNIASGGCTLVHFAAKRGELELVKLLVAGPLHMNASALDWDGNSPYWLALLHGHDDVATFLEAFAQHARNRPDGDAIAIRRDARDLQAKNRYIASMDASEPMTQAHVFPAIWSLHECRLVLTTLESVTQLQGWCTQRHAAYPTTDLPSYQAVPMDAWVRASIRARLFPQIQTHYAIPSTQQLSFRELFYVKYEARAGERAELGVHCDGSVLSFNILLNDRSEFEGGGTFFEASKETIHITQGDAAVHSGKVRHAGAPVVQGRRVILVGFLDIIDRIFHTE